MTSRTLLLLLLLISTSSCTFVRYYNCKDIYENPKLTVEELLEEGKSDAGASS